MTKKITQPPVPKTVNGYYEKIEDDLTEEEDTAINAYIAWRLNPTVPKPDESLWQYLSI